MRWPENTTGLSVAGVFKWISIIFGAVFLFQAYQGLIQGKNLPGAGWRVGEYVAGNQAVTMGLQNLGFSVLCGAIAWALWFFLQRHEK